MCKKIYTIEFYLHMYIDAAYNLYLRIGSLYVLYLPICEDQVLSSIQFYSQTIDINTIIFGKRL